jgi:hypothetical protein
MKRSGVAVSALHFYERKGLIQAARSVWASRWPRSPRHCRRCPRDVRRLRPTGGGCLSLKACPLRNAQDTLAREGPGPHFED